MESMLNLKSVEFIRSFSQKYWELHKSFFEKHKIIANVIFLSANLYGKVLSAEREFFTEDYKEELPKILYGLPVKILDLQEGGDEMYIGIIEE